MVLTSGPDRAVEWKLCLFVTSGLVRGPYIPHVTGKRASEVLGAGAGCAGNNHDVCSAAGCHHQSITGEAYACGVCFLQLSWVCTGPAVPA